MFRSLAAKRSVREVLAERTGSGVMEGLGGIALVLLTVGALALGVSSNMLALSTIATKAERHALVTSLVGDAHSVATWGTPAAPNTTNVTLPNGHKVPVTTWREDTAVSTRFTAVTPISSDPGSPTCSGPSAVAKTGCLYSSRVHAKDLDELSPRASVRKHPSMGGKVIGTVDARVSTGTALPQGAVIARHTEKGAAGSTTVQRYLIEAHSLEAGAEIVVTQGDATLAKIPVDSEMHTYFGSLTAASNSPLQVTVSAGNVVVSSVFIYFAGGTT